MSLSLWTVFDHPSDYPNSFVARAFELDQLTANVIVVPDLEELRGNSGVVGPDPVGALPGG